MQDFPSLIQSYQNVPELQCSGCKGECCVSPTMTAAEFIVMMRHILASQGENWLAKSISSIGIEHEHWHGNSYCRFQNRDNGLCQVYEGRAMACRLHGHEALKTYATPDSVFCEYQPDHHRLLSSEKLESLVDPIRNLVGQIGAPYQAPFYFVSLNLESWLDFYYHPEWAKDRPQLEKAWLDLRQGVKLPAIVNFERTTLRGKLDAIEKAFQLMIQDKIVSAATLFESLQNDFPSVGTYFVEEASNWYRECTAMISGNP